MQRSFHKRNVKFAQFTSRFGRLSPFMAATLSGLALLDGLTGLWAYNSLTLPLAGMSIAQEKWRAPQAAPFLAAGLKTIPVQTEALNRPIFSKTRRPPSEEDQSAKGVATSATAAVPVGMSVRGIAIIGSTRFAFIACGCEALAEGKWFKEGETLAKWIIEHINDRDVIFKADAHSIRLTLDYTQGEEKAPHPSITPRPAPPPEVNPVPAPNRIRNAKGIRG